MATYYFNFFLNDLDGTGGQNNYKVTQVSLRLLVEPESLPAARTAANPREKNKMITTSTAGANLQIPGP